MCVVCICSTTSPYREVCRAKGGIGSGETLCHDIYPARPITTVSLVVLHQRPPTLTCCDRGSMMDVAWSFQVLRRCVTVSRRASGRRRRRPAAPPRRPPRTTSRWGWEPRRDHAPEVTRWPTARRVYWMMDGHSSCAPRTVGPRVQFSGAREQSHWWPASAYSRRPSVISGSSSD